MAQPKINTSSKGRPAASKTQPINPSSKYPNYDFQNMNKEQMGKIPGKSGKPRVLRFSLSVPNANPPTTFSAHIDPQHITDGQGKRLVLVDVLTGIVAQDFGFVAETIELQGTTGAKYYTEIEKMDTVFNSQSISANPTPCTLTIEGRNYQVVWKDFQFERQAQENVYKYTLSFVVLQPGNGYYNGNGTGTSGSAQATLNSSNIKGTFSDGKAITTTHQWTGQTPRAYVMGNNSIPKTKANVALSFIKQYWPTGNKTTYRGPDSALNNGEVLVIPQNWNSVLNGSTLVSGDAGNFDTGNVG